MSFIDDVDSLKSKLHLRDMPTSLRIGLVILCAVVLFVLFQGLWQLGAGDTHLIEGSNQSSWEQDTNAEDLQIDTAQAVEGEGGQNETATPAASAMISVHVVGEVVAPGLYEVLEGARVKDAIDAAGGMTADAEQSSVNLARTIADGEQVVVTSKNSSSASVAISSSSTNSASSASTGVVNINTADATMLTSLSGIGEATAQKIIADREKNGPFKTKKDITRVSGIGDKKYEAIKDSITV